MRRTALMMVLLLVAAAFGSSNPLKPYTLGARSGESLTAARDEMRAALKTAGLTVLGEYAPAGDETRWVIVFNAPELTEAVQLTGDLTGFALALRVALTADDTGVDISYTTPAYWGNAYFQKAYPDVEHLYLALEKKLKTAMAGLGTVRDVPFGSEDGLTAKELRHYHYMFGMEYFEDVVDLNSFSSYSVAKSVIESKLSKGGDTRLVYAMELPGAELKLYGVALSGATGEGHFLPIIDIGTPRHSAFLPYEILLKGNQAVMLHGRYRIALSFPDLSMTTFGKIMSTPGDIEDLMRSVTE